MLIGGSGGGGGGGGVLVIALRASLRLRSSLLARPHGPNCPLRLASRLAPSHHHHSPVLSRLSTTTTFPTSPVLSFPFSLRIPSSSSSSLTHSRACHSKASHHHHRPEPSNNNDNSTNNRAHPFNFHKHYSAFKDNGKAWTWSTSSDHTHTRTGQAHRKGFTYGFGTEGATAGAAGRWGCNTHHWSNHHNHHHHHHNHHWSRGFHHRFHHHHRHGAGGRHWFHNRRTMNHFWSDFNWTTRRQLRRMFWRVHLRKLGHTLWKFRSEDCRRNGGQRHFYHKQKWERKMNGGTRSRRSMAYFAMRDDRYRKDDTGMVARAVGAHLGAASVGTIGGPPGAQQQQHQHHHHLNSDHPHTWSSSNSHLKLHRGRHGSATRLHLSSSSHPSASPFLASSIRSLLSVPTTLTTSLRLLSTASHIRPPISLPTSSSTQSTATALQSGLPFLLPLTTLLKSTAALNIITTISRLALTLLPLSVRAKIIHALRERFIANPSSFAQDSWVRRMVERGGGATADSGWGMMKLNAKVLLPLLVALPFVLLGGIVVASFERTPITGRRRIVMLSPGEEVELVDSILSLTPAGPTSIPSSPPPHSTAARQQPPPQPQFHFQTTTQSRDWPSILRAVLSLPDEGVSPITGRRILLGGEVLDERDWRVRWTEAVLRALERGVEGLAARGPSHGSSSSHAHSNSHDHDQGVLNPPPTRFPLRPRPSVLTTTATAATGAGGGLVDEESVGCEYDLLVIDRQEANAFSFGFGPDQVGGGTMGSAEGRRGVIVVYSGFLDEILSRPHVPTSLSIPAPTPAPASTTSSFFRKPQQQPQYQYQDLTTVPSASELPTPLQTKSLAVLLSHELAHLVLSHTLESYASTSLLVPQLSKLGSDVLRTLIYPVTALLGPFLNDSIGASLNVGAQGGFGILGRVVNSCGSRVLEQEADVVALRLLAHSGIDPHHALNFWEDRLSTPPPSITPTPSTTTAPPPPPSNANTSHLLRLHSPETKHSHDEEACGFLRTHPVNEERVQRLRDELREWERFGALAAAGLA
ncbi:hypothetical protein T439DRAFT_382101 [Meredithblackwellia eburnea MCA 4105]